MKEIVETVKLDSFKEETPVEEKKPEPVKTGEERNKRAKSCF